jgi:hypothetical protein
MTPVDDASASTATHGRDGLTNTPLEIGSQVDAKRVGGVADVASGRRSRAGGTTERNQVGADLQFVALVNPLATSRRLHLDRDE